MIKNGNSYFSIRDQERNTHDMNGDMQINTKSTLYYNHHNFAYNKKKIHLKTIHLSPAEKRDGFK